MGDDKLSINNRKLYDKNWVDWVEMKVHGPASRWLRVLIIDILKYVKKEEIKSVLDVGCGEGTITYDIAKYFSKADVTGIDFSKTGIKLASANYKLANLNFKYDLQSKLLNRNYDLITAFEVLEHVGDWKRLLRRMARSSKYLLLSFPTGRMRAFEVSVGHVRNFKKGEVENFLLTENFISIKIFYAGFPFFSPLYREFCNFTGAANNLFTKGTRYGLAQKLISSILFLIFNNLSSKNNYGDQFCGLFEKQTVFD